MHFFLSLLTATSYDFIYTDENNTFLPLPPVVPFGQIPASLAAEDCVGDTRSLRKPPTEPADVFYPVSILSDDTNGVGESTGLHKTSTSRKARKSRGQAIIYDDVRVINSASATGSRYDRVGPVDVAGKSTESSSSSVAPPRSQYEPAGSSFNL